MPCTFQISLNVVAKTELNFKVKKKKSLEEESWENELSGTRPQSRNKWKSKYNLREVLLAHYPPSDQEVVWNRK